MSEANQDHAPANDAEVLKALNALRQRIDAERYPGPAWKNVPERAKRRPTLRLVLASCAAAAVLLAVGLASLLKERPISSSPNETGPTPNPVQDITGPAAANPQAEGFDDFSFQVPSVSLPSLGSSADFTWQVPSIDFSFQEERIEGNELQQKDNDPADSGVVGDVADLPSGRPAAGDQLDIAALAQLRSSRRAADV